MAHVQMVGKNIIVKIVDAIERSDQTIIIRQKEKKKFYVYIKNVLVFEESEEFLASL